MKIIQIIPELGYGGAETMVEWLSVCLKEQGNSVILISLYDKKTEQANRLIKNGVQLIFLGKKKGLDFSIISKLARIIKREKPDVVHSHLYSLKYAAVAALLCNVKVVVHTTHNTAQKEMGEKDRFFNRMLYHHTRVVPVALSKEIQQSIIEEYALTTADVPIVFNGVQMSKVEPKTSYEIDDKFKIIHIGRFQEQKNHRCIIDAAKILKKYNAFEFYLFGEGTLLELTKGYAQEMGVSDCVHFMGTTDDVFAELKKSDAFILPSRWEGMPMTIIEAMCVGLPIVATGVGGVPDMIENEKNGLLIDGTAKELAQSIYRLYSEIDLRRKLGLAALESAGLFTAEEMACNYFKLYQRLGKW